MSKAINITKLSDQEHADIHRAARLELPHNPRPTAAWIRQVTLEKARQVIAKHKSK